MPDLHPETTCSPPGNNFTSYQVEHKVIQVRSFIVVITSTVNNDLHLNSEFTEYRNWKFCNSELQCGNIELGFKTDNAISVENTFSHGQPLRLVLGDDSEVNETSGNTCLASSAFLTIDLFKGSIKAFSSIVGLPPLLVYKADGVVILTSALHLLSGVPRIKRELDVEAVYETFKIGYPLHGRTLLKNVQMLPAGNVLKANLNGKYSVSADWIFPEYEPMADWECFTHSQAEAFSNAVNSLDVTDSFLSLSGGLDTRTVFAALLERGVNIQSSTLSGKNLSLDARIAKKLCERYQNQHYIVNLDKEFLKNIPEYTTEASRLSGGLSSIEQAHEVYFYKQLQHVGSRRISGNLGNQVGRGGVEGTSMRNADVSILNIESPQDSLTEKDQHWLESLSSRTNTPLFKLLLKHEVPYTLVSNYSIGQHFAVQQSPYANRHLIEVTARRPYNSIKTSAFKPYNARLKDLRHRFFGENPATSFQQKVILSQGGFVAECPVNWGWRVKGGISLPGLGLGVLAFCDAYAGLSNPISRSMARGLRLINAEGMHIFKQYNDWLINHMSDFVHDSLHSRKVVESGLLNNKKIDTLLTEFYSRKNSKTKDLIAALDISLAVQHFS